MNKYHNDQNIYVESVYLRVKDITKSIQFYQDALKMKLYKKTETEAWLGSEKAAFLRLQEGNFKSKKRSAGLYHFAILFERREELGAVLQNMNLKGYRLQGASDHDVSEAIYLRDVDGHGIELYVDKDASLWRWSNEEVYMDTKMLNLEKLLQVAQPNHTVLSEQVLLGHVHLSVVDIKKSKAFYEILGFESVLDIEHAVFMSHKKYHHHLAINAWGMLGGALHKEDDLDLEEMVIQYPKKESLEKVVTQLKEMMYNYDLDENTVKLRDPNNISIRLVV